MVFGLFPDPAAGPLPVAAGGRAEAAFGQLAGAPLPEFAGVYERMMFIRVAVLGGTVAPEVSVRAGRGPLVAVSAASRPVFRATGPGGAGTGFVGDVFLVPGPGGVPQVAVGFDRNTVEDWALGIRNLDPSADRLFTWVVADNPAEVVQPWVDPASFVPAFAPAAPFSPDRGTPGTPVVLHGTNFDLGTPRTFFGGLEAVPLAPPAAGQLSMAVPEGLVAAGQPGADVGVTVETGAGTATAAIPFHAEPPEPGFAEPPFTPEMARLGRKLVLHGRNFDFAPVAVEFRALEFFDDPPAPVAGEVLGTPGPADMTVRIPSDVFVLGPIGKISVTVTTAGGSVTCAQALRILVGPPVPTLEDFSPSTVEVGREVTLNGQEFDFSPVTVTFTVEGRGEVPAVLLEPPSATRIRVTAPDLGPEAENQARITVRGQFGSSTSAEVITVTRPAD
ncbi:hypothetical protein LVY72_10895 [Arthrobacter sp. I2-34]|uniref:IPT/TIG domain-containing protein n=1 Tax=Arthrobacter hankyongi TaxID=2904801 RepID=A0ABS9L6Y1_9MICC|nr:IPT/TIG domain-containing protein [Arthrobacter hankyongi]MCG2622419.1 hypothetical protein [Arthrobacter hankyongi]